MQMNIQIVYLEGIKHTQIIGYTKTNEFYAPTITEVNNIHNLDQRGNTLYWNNNIELSKNKPNYGRLCFRLFC